MEAAGCCALSNGGMKCMCKEGATVGRGAKYVSALLLLVLLVGLVTVPARAAGVSMSTGGVIHMQNNTPEDGATRPNQTAEPRTTGKVAYIVEEAVPLGVLPQTETITHVNRAVLTLAVILTLIAAVLPLVTLLRRPQYFC